MDEHGKKVTVTQCKGKLQEAGKIPVMADLANYGRLLRMARSGLDTLPTEEKLADRLTYAIECAMQAEEHMEKCKRIVAEVGQALPNTE